MHKETSAETCSLRDTGMGLSPYDSPLLFLMFLLWLSWLPDSGLSLSQGEVSADFETGRRALLVVPVT